MLLWLRECACVQLPVQIRARVNLLNALVLVEYPHVVFMRRRKGQRPCIYAIQVSLISFGQHLV